MLAVVVVVIFIVGAGVYWYPFVHPHKNISTSGLVYSLSSTRLLSEFSEDETAATEKYAGEIIDVEGKIVYVIIGDKQTAVVLEDRLSGISVYLDNSFVENHPEMVDVLEANQTATFRGQCDVIIK